MNSPGEFEQSPLTMRKVCWIERVARMVRRVVPALSSALPGQAREDRTHILAHVVRSARRLRSGGQAARLCPAGKLPGVDRALRRC
ncbi:MAG: hypothetical protein MZV70_63735 [Desulfobacterales bacterium]|nr:hypothetical protein [Desulfobacterales bacterium]